MSDSVKNLMQAVKDLHDEVGGQETAAVIDAVYLTYRCDVYPGNVPGVLERSKKLTQSGVVSREMSEVFRS